MSISAHHRPDHSQSEKGVRPLMQPSSAEHAAVRVVGPLCPIGSPTRGSMSSCCARPRSRKGFSAPIWMIFKQTLEFKAHIRKGEQNPGRLCRQGYPRESDATTGEEAERAIPFMKSYTVFNVEQNRKLPKPSTPSPKRRPKGNKAMHKAGSLRRLKTSRQAGARKCPRSWGPRRIGTIGSCG